MSKRSSSSKSVARIPLMPEDKVFLSSDEAELADRFGYAASRWAELSEREREVLVKVQVAPRSQYSVHVHLSQLESYLANEQESCQTLGGTFNLEPDFQRGHVWTEAQQVAFVQSFLRGLAPTRILFNSRSHGHDNERKNSDIPYGDFVCIDGLQRLTALRRFMRDELTVFGDETASTLKNTPLDPKRLAFEVQVFSFDRKAALLKFYLDLNSGGTVHSPEEIERVRGLLEQSLPSEQPVTTNRSTPKPA